jgi:hypothetical protein
LAGVTDRFRSIGVRSLLRSALTLGLETSIAVALTVAFAGGSPLSKQYSIRSILAGSIGGLHTPSVIRWWGKAPPQSVDSQTAAADAAREG